MHYDVIVLGLGGMGSAAAHQLAERGLRVLGLEQFEPAHDRGSSHGDSRVIRQNYLEGAFYVPLVQRAYELWRRLERASGRDLLTVTGGLMIGPPRSTTVAGSLESARAHDLDHDVLYPRQVHSRFPTFRLRDDEVALYEPHAGYVVPEQAIVAQLELARRADAELLFTQPVRSWDADGGHIVVRTDHDRFSARHLVVCAGAWTSRVLERLALPLAVERQVMHWLTPPDRAPFRAGRHPVYLWEYTAGDFLYGFPALPGQRTIKTAFFRRANPADPDALERTVTDAERLEITEILTRLIPRAGSHDHARACMYTMTPDHHFVIGSHPQLPRVTLAAGFSGHGFKFAPVVGEVLADLVTGGGTAHDITAFDPARFGEVSG